MTAFARTDMLCRCSLTLAIARYRAPIKRLRWKDHRNMAMRGDDVIGMTLDPASQRLRFLKTEAKSRIDLRAQTLQQARTGLDKEAAFLRRMRFPSSQPG